MTTGGIVQSRGRRAAVLGGIAALLLLAPARASAQTTPESAPQSPPPEGTAAPPPTTPAAEPTTTTTATTTTTTTTETSNEAAAREEKEKKKQVEGGDRRLKDHVFIFPAYVATSFVASYIGVRIRLGERSIDNLPTVNGPIHIRTQTFAEGLEGGIKLTDWLGLNVTGSVRSLIGSDFKALVYDGATYDIGGIGSLIARLYHNERTGTQLSLSGYGGYTRGQVASLLPIFDTPGQTLADALRSDLRDAMKTPTTLVTYGGRLGFAQSIHPLFGIQASAAVGGSTLTSEPWNTLARARTSSHITGVTYSLGIAPSVDFAPLKVPVAVMPEYLIARTASSAEVRGAGDFDTYHQLVVGAYYSGRTNLQLGLIWSAVLSGPPLRSPQGVSSTPSQNTTELVLRYVW